MSSVAIKSYKCYQEMAFRPVSNRHLVSLALNSHSSYIYLDAAEFRKLSLIETGMQGDHAHYWSDWHISVANINKHSLHLVCVFYLVESSCSLQNTVHVIEPINAIASPRFLLYQGQQSWISIFEIITTYKWKETCLSWVCCILMAVSTLWWAGC